MRLLAVDTATQTQSVALLEDERTVARSDRTVQGAHAKWLVPAIEDLLRRNNLALQDLGGLAVSVGPGSFTGLRVGLATMLGLRCVTGLPLVGVPTLDAMAWNLREADGQLCPVLKARTGEAYWAFYRWTATGDLTCLATERVGRIEDLAAGLLEPTLVFGEGWQAFKESLRRCLGSRWACAREAPREASAASAVSVGRAGLRRLAMGAVVPVGFAPRYVQRSEAELNWERGRKRASAQPGRP